jgi:hypothetical protein
MLFRRPAAEELQHTDTAHGHDIVGTLRSVDDQKYTASYSIVSFVDQVSCVACAPPSIMTGHSAHLNIGNTRLLKYIDRFTATGNETFASLT